MPADNDTLTLTATWKRANYYTDDSRYFGTQRQLWMPDLTIITSRSCWYIIRQYYKLAQWFLKYLQDYIITITGAIESAEFSPINRIPCRYEIKLFFESCVSRIQNLCTIIILYLTGFVQHKNYKIYYFYFYFEIFLNKLRFNCWSRQLASLIIIFFKQ